MNHFFPVQHLILEQRRAICEKAKEICQHWWVDELDCKKSFIRQKVEMSFDEIMKKFVEGTHFTIIHRKNDIEDFLEIGFRTGKVTDYFLWIILDRDKLEETGYK